MIILTVIGIVICACGAIYYTPKQPAYFALMLFGLVGWAVSLGWVLSESRSRYTVLRTIGSGTASSKIILPEIKDYRIEGIVFESAPPPPEEE